MKAIVEDSRFQIARQAMVAAQLQGRGIRDQRVLDAFLRVPRQEFIPPEYWREAYEDHPVPVGHAATISQPYMVAIMIEALNVERIFKVLEIGTGTGYQAALLSQMAESVVTIERIPDLAQRARENFERLGITNAEVITGDGTLGAPQHAPFDRIIVAAAAPHIPEPLFDQLAEGGTLLIPVGPGTQELQRITRVGSERRVENLGSCRFVPLIGGEGNPEQ